MNKPAHDVAQPYLSPSRQNTPVDPALVAHQPDKALRVLRIKQLIERTNLSRATLYALMSNDLTFPRKIKLTARSVGFLESEVDAWIAARADSRNAA
ncbi:helix-turn-helix transcriptional regulator [Burkholderia semiarida]|uniref:helix-turn-helix transcriptional regulator n=1 Tax=Burkholderia semiarida TaxID=2843303 RepID=UPI0023DDE383|nr:AlpA family transcriptional regulator [Burkholderia semiarida]MDF3095100.1 AlpA family transcriptional regulator [Burkholderia semiarida]HDR9105116.1 AlpA family transcriptional regulator [Burkholderia vietnamiensis]